MKTNRLARRIVKVHFILVWVAVVAIAGLEVTVGHSLVSRIGQNCGTQTPGTVCGVPSMSFGDVMNAAGR